MFVLGLGIGDLAGAWQEAAAVASSKPPSKLLPQRVAELGGYKLWGYERYPIRSRASKASRASRASKVNRFIKRRRR